MTIRDYPRTADFDNATFDPPIFQTLGGCIEEAGDGRARVRFPARHELTIPGGFLQGGIQAAIGWVADNLPVFSLNFVLATATDLWALRYPETHNLFVSERAAGGEEYHGGETGTAGAMRIRSPELAGCRSVVLATEAMDEDPGWRLLEPGELLHVPVDLCCTSSTVIDRPPAHPLTLHDLDERAAASQSADTGAAAAARRP